MTKAKITPSSGNVFADAGLPDAKELLLKSQIAIAIRQAIAEKGLKQREAAELMEVSQSHVSKIIRGHLDEYSIERLIRFLNALDLDVEMSIVQIAKTA